MKGLAVILFLICLSGCTGDTGDGNEKTDEKPPVEKTLPEVIGEGFGTMILVKGGTYTTGEGENRRTVTVSDFYIGKYEATYSVVPYIGSIAEDTSASATNWFRAVMMCNNLSVKEGLTPVYLLNGSPDFPDDSVVYKYGKYTIDKNADGYRLPTDEQWEWAAMGGVKSKGYKYSGSNNIDEVAVYGQNNIDNNSCIVGEKCPNELGIYDMSGNRWEWIEDIGSAVKKVRGGCKNSDASECEITSQKIVDSKNISFAGFRFCRNVPSD